MHRVNRSVPWKEQAKARLAPDLTVRECQKGAEPPLDVASHEVGFQTLSYGVPMEGIHVGDVEDHATPARPGPICGLG